MYRSIGKRALDCSLSIIAFVVFSPIILCIYILIWRELGSPLFRQQRPGLHGKPFTLYKFRTMTDARNADGSLLPEAERLTNFGRFLRRTSLDELPELINVLKGDMSLVGPRPLLMSYLPYYTDRERLRHNIRPGITGLAQINGRNYLDWEQRLELDVQYVENHTLLLDIGILLRTLLKVLAREGIDVPQTSRLLSEQRKNRS